LVAPYRQSLADRATIAVSHGTFDEQLTGVLTDAAAKNLSLVPAFVMVDPFGISHTPMSVISQILKNKKSEVYISVMTDWIDRIQTGTRIRGTSRRAVRLRRMARLDEARNTEGTAPLSS